MNVARLSKVALIAAVFGVLMLAPASIGTQDAVAFEFFEYCPANPCTYLNLPTAGVCAEGQQIFSVRREYTGGLCYEAFNL